MNKLISAFSRALWDSDLIGSRITLAIGEFIWAILLFWPGDTFDRPTYTHMAMVMCEEWWAVLFLLSALIQMSIVLKDDMHSDFARWFAFWNMVLWSYTVFSMMISVSPPPAAIGGEISITISAIWIWARPYILAEGYRAARQN